MEKRNAKIIIGKSGGTAAKNSKTYKLSLPTAWIDNMGLNETDRKVELCFDGEKITIIRKYSSDEFICRKKKMRHDVREFKFYDGDVLCSVISADFTDKTLCVENHTANLVKTAFGMNNNPVWSDFETFLEERCVPKNRSGIREYLETIGLESYSPIEIIAKTGGRMAEDNQWIEMRCL